MVGLYLLSVWLHIMAAMVWIGSSVFLVVGVLPYFRRADDPHAALDYIAWSVPRLRAIGWACFATLIATGIFILDFRGYDWVHLFDGSLFRGPFGRTLAEKLGLVIVVLLLSAYHDFRLGPRTLELRRAAPDSPEAQRARKMTIRAGQVNLVLALLIVALGVMLVRGRPG